MTLKKFLILFTLIFSFASISNAQSLKEIYENGKKAFYADSFEEANNYFSQILSRESNDYESCYYKALVYEVNFDYDKALSELTNAIGFKPKSTDAYFERGTIYDKQTKIPEAIQDYSKAIKYNKSHADAYFNRASDYQELKQYNDAIKDYSKVVKLNPADDIAYYNRGLLYKEISSYPKAINDFETAIKIDKAWERQLRPVIDELKKGN